MQRLLTLAMAGAIALAAVILPPKPAAAVGLIRDTEIERTLKMLSDPIFHAAGLNPDSIHIYIVNSREVNAFVANGRNMFLNSGLLMKLKTPDELQAVIAHETGHIAGGHEARRAANIRDARGPALLGMLAGIAAGVLTGSPDVGMALMAGSDTVLTRQYLGYSRGEEATADQSALRYLRRADIDPMGMKQVLDMFRGEEVLTIGNVDPYVLTHPLSTERLELIDKAVEATRGKTYPKHPQLDYWFQRMRAKLTGFLRDPAWLLGQDHGKPQTETLQYEEAIALYRLPALKEALAATDKLIAKRPDDPFYNELKGQFLFETGHPEEALPLYRKANRLAPDEPLLQNGLGRVLLALNTPQADREALKILQDARAHDPGDATGLRDLAIAYARAGKTGMATLATAERFALRGDTKDATLQATRAAALLPHGSPGWLRAQDILALKKQDN